MIYLWVGFFLCVVIGGVSWYLCNVAVQSAIYTIQATYPQYLAGSWVQFLVSLWEWMLLLYVLLPGLLWIYVNAQRRDPEGYVY